MALAKALFLWLTCHLLLLKADSKCQPSFPCRNFTLQFPFTDILEPECGLFPVDGCDSLSEYTKVHIGAGQSPRSTLFILAKISENKFVMEDFILQALLRNRSCLALSDMSLMNTPSVSFTFSPNFTIFECLREIVSEEEFKDYQKKECDAINVYYKNLSTHHGPAVRETRAAPFGCAAVQLPKSNNKSGDLIDLLSARFTVEWSVSKACSKCHDEGGKCFTDDQNKFYCKQDTPNIDSSTADTHKIDSSSADKSRWKLILALSVSGAGILLVLSITYIIWQRKKMSSRRYLRSKNISLPKQDNDGGIFCFGIPVFSYEELDEATNNFDPSRELGNGAFGTVYHGSLGDGREVAIKRMYEHNFKRVEQFLNEIKILTSLRHPNLVFLYGCTSRTSRELLLVYEYISNGTVADHLHGKRANESLLSWPIRLNIAVETAEALAFLHKSDIIHRDVKTNNILLDNNYSVKVADFGLSRLFPENVTHISTAPQGTPGYVDPEYNQYYQLTDKSDVYSFGVVLIELISSMPAVDVNRHRDEINLANLAINRIQRCAFDELIISSLGYGSDPEVTRMTTTVAELAFRCLQVDKDLRPSMDEVVTFLIDIKGGEDCKFKQRKQGNGNHNAPGRIPPSPKTGGDLLLMNKKFHSSPTRVSMICSHT